MILPGILASGISGHLTPPSSYASIATYTVGSGGSSTITFSSIPQTFKHLQIRALITTPSTSSIYDNTTFNGDAGANYSWHFLNGNGSSAGTDASSSASFLRLWTMGSGPYGSGTTGWPAVGIADILDYTNTNKYKTTRGLAGGDSNSTSQPSIVGLASGSWRNTAAITSITINAFAVGSATTFGQYSSFALYGIKG
jgi:hypothetical protein